MSESNYGRPGNEGHPQRIAVTHDMKSDRNADTRPYWKRAHHDFRFWIGMALMLAAIAMYIMTGDLGLLPLGGQSHVTLPRNTGK